MSQNRLFVWKNHWKQLALGLHIEWGRVSGNQQGKANSVSQVDGKLDVVPACRFCGRRAQKRNNDLSQHLCPGEICSFSSCLDARLSSFTYVPVAPALGFTVSESQ